MGDSCCSGKSSATPGWMRTPKQQQGLLNQEFASVLNRLTVWRHVLAFRSTASFPTIPKGAPNNQPHHTMRH